MPCHKCNSRPIEYDSPDLLCRQCWAEWWVESISDEPNREEYLKEVLENIQREYGDPPIEDFPNGE